MAVDNRTELNDCEQDAGWTGTDNPDLQGVSSGDEVYYQGSECMGAQFTNAQEYIIVGENSAGTALNENLSTSTVWLLVKDNLIETQANGGFQIVLANGTGGASAIIGFYVGGNDSPGLVLGKTYYCIRLDVSNIGSFSSFAHNGALGNLNTSSITDIGYGSLHVTAARGNVNNLWVDRITSNANNSYAFTVDLGTSGTPITFSSLVADDNTSTNGWGLFASGPGASYTVYASTEFGSSSADSYFLSSNEQIFLDGTGMGSGNWIFRVFGNGTSTNSFTLDNSVIASPGEGAIWDMTDTNIDVLDIQNCTFLDMGTMNFPVSGGTTRQVTDTTFIGCDQLDFATITASNISISGSTASALGAILLDTDGQTSSQTDFTFTGSGVPGSGHAVYITATGDYDFTNWTFSGYSTTSPGTNNTPASGSTDAMVYNNSGGVVRISVDGGTNVTVRNGSGATTEVIANVTVSIPGVLGNSEIKVLPTAGSPFSGNSLSDFSTPIATETVSADTNTGDGGSNYMGYTNNGGFVQINANGTNTFTNFPGVLQDTNSSIPRNLAAGDKVRVTIRDDTDNSSLQLYDEFEVSGTPSASTILTTTSFSGFTSVFGTTLNSANSKTVTVEKVDARFRFTVAAGTAIDFTAYRVGSNPILIVNQSIANDNNSFPISQVGDRNYRNPA